ncbi:phytanoyl-CoA dioxygenase family protein [Oxalobacteraceae bacterium R-40]|uniref:Phytanoyl-CoA dioxygenase family protein n=1 Tax=Keguizhuia sedimenti TaxID=3064264 RepID=A0ABU1BSF4_9BURK|nr:phytanoyl-CoA dioxygenase family protein [Oxalobacteraceae bacterium R-40]
MNAVATALSERQIEQFRQDGYLIIRAMVPMQQCRHMAAVAIAHLRQAVPPLEYEAQVGYPGAPASLDAPGGRTIRRLRSAYQRDASFAQWASDPDLVAKLAVLLGENVCLTQAHHNCIMTKHPDFGTATGWHRDIRYWSFARPDLISVWLALDHEHAGNGALRFIPGSHQLQIAPDRLDELDFLKPGHPENQALFAQGVTPELQQGDVVFFHSGVFHAAGRNAAASTKLSAVFAYHGCSNTPCPGTRTAAYESVHLGK